MCGCVCGCVCVGGGGGLCEGVFVYYGLLTGMVDAWNTTQHIVQLSASDCVLGLQQ